MDLFNNWKDEPLIHEKDILNFSFLEKHNLITKEKDIDYFSLKNPSLNLELMYYSEKNIEMASKLNIVDIDATIKCFIKDLHLYNEIKDIADALMGKISEIRGVSLLHVREEFGLNEE